MANVNLAALLSTTADQAKRPVPFNDGTYYGVIKGFQMVESDKKKTPGVEYDVELTHAAEGVDLVGYDEDGQTVQLNPAGVHKRTTFWITENSLFMLKDFIKSCGIEVENRTFQELIPQVVGQPVICSITKSPSNRPEGGFYNNLEKVVGAATAQA
jgi:hypothetical protein